MQSHLKMCDLLCNDLIWLQQPYDARVAVMEERKCSCQTAQGETGYCSRQLEGGKMGWRDVVR